MLVSISAFVVCRWPVLCTSGCLCSPTRCADSRIHQPCDSCSNAGAGDRDQPSSPQGDEDANSSNRGGSWSPQITIHKALAAKKILSHGRAHSLSPSDVGHIVTVLPKLVVNANTRYEASLAMRKKAANSCVCHRTISRALLSRGVQLRRLRTKPTLTPEDIKPRLLLATSYKDASAAWWKTNIEMITGCKTFPAYIYPHGRS